jgi:hypothetical protein
MAVSLRWLTALLFYRKGENDMRRKLTDEEISEKYKEMIDSLTTLTRNCNETFVIVWNDIFKIVYDSNIKQKKDFFGFMMNQLTGTNNGTDIYWDLEQETDKYKVISKKYKYGNSVSDMGIVWKELIVGEKYFRLQILLSYLALYEEQLLPYVKREMKDWLIHEEYQTGKEMIAKDRMKDWKTYRGNMRTTKNIIKTVLDILKLRNASLSNERYLEK